MDFGRIAFDPAGINFQLPPSDPANAVLLARATQPVGPSGPVFEAYVGCPVWQNREWLGSVYPRSAKPRDFFQHYVRQFNCIELNSTYYAIPTPETVRRWRDIALAANPAFRFCPKVPLAISRELHASHRAAWLLREFCNVMLEFGPTLGVSFVQCPPHFDVRGLERLERVLTEGSPPGFPMALEVRHPSWFVADSHHLQPAVRSVLERLGCGLVITDTPGRRDVLHASLTSPQCFVRLAGHALHPTDTQRVEFWAERLALWKSQGLQSCYFFIHQMDQSHAATLSNVAVAAFNQKLGTHLTPWTSENALGEPGGGEKDDEDGWGILWADS